MEEDDKEATLIFRVMAAPLIARLRFHFSGSRPTNRIEKPEWIFEQVLDTINKNSAFVTDFIEPILRRHMAKTAGSTTIIDAKVKEIVIMRKFLCSNLCYA